MPLPGLTPSCSRHGTLCDVWGLPQTGDGYIYNSGTSYLVVLFSVLLFILMWTMQLNANNNIYWHAYLYYYFHYFSSRMLSKCQWSMFMCDCALNETPPWYGATIYCPANTAFFTTSPATPAPLSPNCLWASLIYNARKQNRRHLEKNSTYWNMYIAEAYRWPRVPSVFMLCISQWRVRQCPSGGISWPAKLLFWYATGSLELHNKLRKWAYYGVFISL